MNTLNRLRVTLPGAPVNWAGKLWPALAAVVLGVVLARWVWIFLAPAGMAVLPPAEIGTSEDAEKIFGVATSAAAGIGTVILPGARLVGVFAPASSTGKVSKNKTGFAVLQLDEKRQSGVALGDEVVPGVKLIEIHADRVLLERDGITQLITLEGSKQGESSAMAPGNISSSPSLATTRIPAAQAAPPEIRQQMQGRGPR